MSKGGDDRLEMIRTVQKELKYARFIHTMGVAFTAASLAERYDCDMRKAETAGILHDCAKYMDVNKMENLCLKNGLEISPLEKEMRHFCIPRRDAFLPEKSMVSMIRKFWRQSVIIPPESRT